MRNLTIILLPAFLIFLALTPLAQAGESEGIWINPTLGISTPQEAVDRLRQPFHSWYISKNDSLRNEAHWRKHIYLLYTPPSRQSMHPRPNVQLGIQNNLQENDFRNSNEVVVPNQRATDASAIRIESCNALLTAIRSGYEYLPTSNVEERVDQTRAHTWLSWVSNMQITAQCELISELARLRPIVSPISGTPGFLPKRSTVSRLTPVASLVAGPIESLCYALHAEQVNEPNLYLRRKFRFLPDSEESSSEALSGPGEKTDFWSIRGEGDIEEVNGIRFVPTLHIEGRQNHLQLSVWGVGNSPNRDEFVIVTYLTSNLKHGSANSFVVEPLVLTYDQEIDMFRLANREYYEFLLARLDPFATCDYRNDTETDD